VFQLSHRGQDYVPPCSHHSPSGPGEGRLGDLPPVLCWP
jgi:hypothetical protein